MKDYTIKDNRSLQEAKKALNNEINDNTEAIKKDVESKLEANNVISKVVDLVTQLWAESADYNKENEKPANSEEISGLVLDWTYEQLTNALFENTRSNDQKVDWQPIAKFISDQAYLAGRDKLNDQLQEGLQKITTKK